MHVNQIADRMTLREKVIMAVHIYAHQVDADVMGLTVGYGVMAIEDAAEPVQRNRVRILDGFLS
jgi:dTDP-4-amino-4,6-dideoxygalactose transaminase